MIFGSAAKRLSQAAADDRYVAVGGLPLLFDKRAAHDRIDTDGLKEIPAHQAAVNAIGPTVTGQVVVPARPDGELFEGCVLLCVIEEVGGQTGRMYRSSLFWRYAIAGPSADRPAGTEAV